MDNIKILLADSHGLYRDALVQYIERAQDNTTIITSKSLHETYQRLIANPDTDLIMLDLQTSGFNGLYGLYKILESYRHIPVLVFGGLRDSFDQKDVMNAGASGYFPKTLSGHALIKAIDKILEGEEYVPSQDNTILFNPYMADQVQEQKIHLTPREKQVMNFLLQGSSNKEIARALNIEVVTVKLHVRGICKKLGAKNRTQAALRARELGLFHAEQQGALAH